MTMDNIPGWDNDSIGQMPWEFPMEFPIPEPMGLVSQQSEQLIDQQEYPQSYWTDTLSYFDFDAHPYSRDLEIASVESSPSRKRKPANEDPKGIECRLPNRKRDNGDRFQCRENGCSKSFVRKADLERHNKTKHNPILVICGCCHNIDQVYQTPRLDKLKEHQRKVHNYNGDFRSCDQQICLNGNGSAKLFFGLEANLKTHLDRKHRIPTICLSSAPEEGECSDTEMFRSSTTTLDDLEGSWSLGCSESTRSSCEVTRSTPLSLPCDDDTYDIDRTSLKRVRYTGAVDEQSRDISTHHQGSSDNKILDKARVASSTLSSPNKSVATYAQTCNQYTSRCAHKHTYDSNEINLQDIAGTGLGIQQRNSCLSVFEDTDMGAQVGCENQQQGSQSDLLAQRSSLYASIVPQAAMIVDNSLEVSIPNVTPAEYLTLYRHDYLRVFNHALKDSLDSMSQLEGSFISFSISARTVRLRGSSRVAQSIGKQLETLLERNRDRPLGAATGTQTSHGPKSNHSFSQQHVSNHKNRLTDKIFAVRKTEDSNILNTWSQRILPFLPDIMSRTIGRTYSASLVRQGVSKTAAQVVIRVQSPIRPSSTVQTYIRKQVIRLCDNHLTDGTIQIQFSEGCLTTLAGSSDEENQDSRTHFPHWKRYWARPGMSASIGMHCTRKISATSCCYIHVDGVKLLLTVKHFIQESQSKNDNGGSDQQILTSPALLEIDKMIEYFDQLLREIEVEIEEELKEQHGDILPVLLNCSDTLSILESKKQYVTELADEASNLRRDDKDLVLASIAHQNKSDTRIHSAETLASWLRLACTEPVVCHQMDWSLWSVTNTNRVGVNRTRYRFDSENKKTEFYAGDFEKLGAGEPCQRTCQVEPNAEVYYVGQTSGRLVAEVNPAPMQVCCDGKVRSEWTLIVAEEDQKKDEKYGGDSGAGIMRTSDNSLMGMLWGCDDKHLLFTPINDVMADIKDQLNATDIVIAPLPPDSDLAPAVVSSTAPREATRICRDSTKESPDLRRPKTSDLQLPHRPNISRSECAPIHSNPLPSEGTDVLVQALSIINKSSSQTVPISKPSCYACSYISSATAASSWAQAYLSRIPYEVISTKPKSQTTFHKPIILTGEKSEANIRLAQKYMPNLMLQDRELSKRFLRAEADGQDSASHNKRIQCLGVGRVSDFRILSSNARALG